MKLKKRVTKKLFLPNDEDKAWVEIKILSTSKIQEIAHDCYAIDLSNTGTTDTPNHLRFATAYAAACIVEWGNFTNEKGKSLKLTTPTLARLLEQDLELDDKEAAGKSMAIWVYTQYMLFHEEFEKEQKEALGN